jgi:hypothetical protein
LGLSKIQELSSTSSRGIPSSEPNVDGFCLHIIDIETKSGDSDLDGSISQIFNAIQSIELEVTSTIGFNVDILQMSNGISKKW